jgi:diphthamide biosynthesis enzyme Dph1/Dph2-like protein
MKTLFIPAKINLEINEKKILGLNLPINIVIAYSIQYKEVALKIKNILSKKNKILSTIQVLGCSSPKLPKETEAILLISSGKFHAVSLAATTNLPVYLFESSELKKISKEEIELFNKRKKVAYLKFLNEEKIGVLISTKPGQENLKKSLSLKLKNKILYFFVANNINNKEFENFGINSWINTACPRLDFDNSIINLTDLENLIK